MEKSNFFQIQPFSLRDSSIVMFTCKLNISYEDIVFEHILVKFDDQHIYILGIYIENIEHKCSTMLGFFC